MVSDDDNARMCRVGADTPMGTALRRFWLPACLSSELAEPDGDPLHIQLLNENFVAFRDSEGQIGILDEQCCHRGASLTIGRVESCGIRCIYHGWLFSRDGTVLETPNVNDQSFKQRFKAKAYPAREAGGLVWTYLGEAGSEPEFPDFDWLDADPSMRMAGASFVECNWVQLLEGLLDSSHLSVLHSSSLQRVAGASDINYVAATSHMRWDAAPRIESEETDYGLRYAAIRTLDGKAETRVTHYMSPFWVLNPNGDFISGLVPISDTKTAFYRVWWDGLAKWGEEPLFSTSQKLIGIDAEGLEKFGSVRRTPDVEHRPTRANNWHQDRALMRTGHFTGVQSLSYEDALVCLSAGPIRSRVVERLASVDLAIVHLYRSLMRTVRQVADGGDPVGYGLPIGHLRGHYASLAPDQDWRSLLVEQRKEAASTSA